LKTKIITALLTVFVVMFVTCEAANDKTNPVSDLKVNAKVSPEGIYLYFDNIPENAQYLSVSLYDITADDNLYTGANFHGNDLEQIKKMNVLLCPFVKSGHEYEITVTAFIETKENIKPINSSAVTAIAGGGIHIINNPILIWNNSDNIASLSERPVFSDD